MSDRSELLGDVPAAERDDDLLTRTEASAFLLRFQIRLKPATLARMWSVGADGPPCQHIRGKPWYPRGALRAWAQAQRTGIRGSRRDHRAPSARPVDAESAAVCRMERQSGGPSDG